MLGYKFFPGDHYEFEQVVDVHLYGSDDTIQNSATAKLKLAQDVIKVHEDGSAVIRMTVKTLERVGSIGTDEFSLMDLEGRQIQLKMEPNGLVSAVEIAPTEGQNEEVRRIKTELEALFFRLPHRLVGPGDRWDDQIIWSLDYGEKGPIDQVINMAYELVRFEDFAGSPCARIDLNGDFFGTMDQGNDGFFQGRLEGSFLFGVENGREMESNIAYVTKFSVNLPEGDYSYQLRVKVHRNLLGSNLVR